MSNETNTKQQPVPVLLGPGAILKAAREKNGLTIADIASRLHLKLVNIESIEADEFDPAVALTFTKGYLKLYARQVNVPESDVLEAFACLYVEEKEPAKLQSFSKRVAKQANDDRLMMVTYLIIAIVVALVVIWWFQQDSGDDDIALVAPATPTVTAEHAALPTPDDLIVSAQFEVATTVNEEQLEPALPAADIADLTTTADDLVEIGQALAELNKPETEAELGAEVESEVNSIQLVFEFADNCWMNLVDSTGEAIAYGVKKSGRVMTISGFSPFEVTLGAPQVVRISYDGVEVDMSRFTPGLTAKFTLPFSN